MKSARGKILYVGKAKSLRARLGSYFRGEPVTRPRPAPWWPGSKPWKYCSRPRKRRRCFSNRADQEIPAALQRRAQGRQELHFVHARQAVALSAPGFHPAGGARRRGYFGPFTSATAARTTWNGTRRACFPAQMRGPGPRQPGAALPVTTPSANAWPRAAKAVDAATYAGLVRRVEAFLTGRSAEVLRGYSGNGTGGPKPLPSNARPNCAIAQGHAQAVEGQATVLTKLVDLDVPTGRHRGRARAVRPFCAPGGLLDGEDVFFPRAGGVRGGLGSGSALLQFYRPDRLHPAAPDRARGPGRQGGRGREGDGQALAAIPGGAAGHGPCATVRPGGARRKSSWNWPESMPRARQEAAKAADADVLPAQARKFGLATLLAHRGRGCVPSRGKACGWAGGVSRTASRAKASTGPTPLRNWKARPDDNRALAAFAAKRAESGPPWPDLLLIDGGKGPARSRVPALAEAGIGDAFALAAIAKGERRSQNELGCDFRTRAQKTL